MVISEKGFQVANTVVAGTGFEDIAEGERTERGVASCTATGNGQAITINQTAFHQILCSVHTIININNAPLPFESFTVSSPIAGAATVIHVEYGNASACPELLLQVKRIGSR